MDLSKVDYLELVREITKRDKPEYLFLYDFWELINKEFFEGKLKPCLVYQAVQPYGASLGYIRGNVREIAIQKNLSKEDMFLALIHEMCHQWQFELSSIEPDTKRIHFDKTWAMILNCILEKFNSQYRAVEYSRKKETVIEPSGKKRINVYVPIIPPELSTFKIIPKEDLLSFPLNYKTYLPSLDPSSYVSIN
jgi:hypothetical protein